MLRRRSRVRVVVAVAVFATLAALVSTPVTAATVPVSTAPSAMLPDTSAATAGAVVGNAAIAAAVPSLAQAAPVLAAAAAPPPPIIPPFLSDGFCSYGGVPTEDSPGLIPDVSTRCSAPTTRSTTASGSCSSHSLRPGDPLYQGQSAAAGDLYSVTCETHNGMNIGNAAATIQYTHPAAGELRTSRSTLDSDGGRDRAEYLGDRLGAGPSFPATGSAPPPGRCRRRPDRGCGRTFRMHLWDPYRRAKRILSPRWRCRSRASRSTGTWATATTSSAQRRAPRTQSRRFRTLPTSVYTRHARSVARLRLHVPDRWLVWRHLDGDVVDGVQAFQVGSTSGTFVVSRTTKIKLMSIGELQAVTE